MIYHQQPGIDIYQGSCLDVLPNLPAESVNCCVTSPPYWGLRDYGHDEQIGREINPEGFVATMVRVFGEVRRVLTDDGLLFLNLGDTYTNKSLTGIPWRVAMALRDNGWFLRSEVIWHKPNPMPESVTDRPTKAHEPVFMLSKSECYWYDVDAIREKCIGSGGASLGKVLAAEKADAAGAQARRMTMADRQRYIDQGRNARSVWSIPVDNFPGAHFATFPRELPERCIKAGCPVGGTVLDPFHGSGTTMEVARDLGRVYVGIELNPTYIELSKNRVRQELLFAAGGAA